MYSRLSFILAENNVFTGGNFTGLPDESYDLLIVLMNMLLKDALVFNKPLFVFQQDISKAFDSMDNNMLRLSIKKLRIPNKFISLTLELFTN